MVQPMQANETRDWVGRPASWLVWWGVPILVGIAASLAGLSVQTVAFVWMAAFGWMGAGCVLNAIRCRRLHCYISGPVFLLGAVLCGLLGAGVLENGSRALGNTVSITLLAALLSFVPEYIWRRYA